MGLSGSAYRQYWLKWCYIVFVGERGKREREKEEVRTTVREARNLLSPVRQWLKSLIQFKTTLVNQSKPKLT